MSIRVRHGMATVELDGWELQAATGRTSTTYSTDDLLQATRRALQAADDARADDVAALLRSRK